MLVGFSLGTMTYNIINNRYLVYNTPTPECLFSFFFFH